jgi:hypothetical protein
VVTDAMRNDCHEQLDPLSYSGRDRATTLAGTLGVMGTMTGTGQRQRSTLSHQRCCAQEYILGH